MNRRFSFVNNNLAVDPDLEPYAVNNQRAVDADHLYERLRELERFDLEVQYQRAFRSCYRRVAAIAASVFLAGLLSYLVYRALKEAKA